MVTRFRRYGQIADVLIKYGFGILIGGMFPRLYRWTLKRHPESVQSVYVRVRLALEELGPTFVKFGQIMSTRRELLPPPLIEELKKLQDQVRPVPFSEVKPYLSERCPFLNDCFAEIEEIPVASASLAQVHRARLKDGTIVALKVQRPGIEEIIETDLAILQSLAIRAEAVFPEARVYNPKGMVQDFSSQIRKELDFVRDGKNSEHLARNFKGIPGIKFPKIFWKHSTRHLLVMEFIDGVRIDDREAIAAMGIEPPAIARRGFDAYMKMIFEDGFFHGDPHPGNLLVTRTGDLVFLDFGMVGILRTERRHLFQQLLYAIIHNDVDRLIKAFEGLGVAIRDEDRESIRDDLYFMLLDSEHTPIGEFNFEGMVRELTDTMRKYQLHVPASLMLMLKVIVMVLDDGKHLDPSFSFEEHAVPFLKQLSKKDRVSDQIFERATRSLVEAAEGLFDLPGNVNKTLKKLSTGTIHLKMEDKDLHRIETSLHSSTDKILVGLITSALVIGSSIVLLTSQMRLPDTVYWLAIFGYAAAVLVGFYALYHALNLKFGGGELR